MNSQTDQHRGITGKTLAEFQSSRGVEFEQQIVLLNNPLFAKGYQACHRGVNIPAAPGLLDRAFRFLNRKLQRDIYLPSSSPDAICNLFLGFRYRSFDYLELLARLFEQIASKTDRTFRILLGKGDYLLDDSRISTMPENVQALIANNVHTTDQRVHFLPMGRDFRSLALFKSMQPESEKTNLVYCNYSVNTHPVRKQVYESLKDSPFIQFEHMGQHRSYQLRPEEFFDRLAKSKFCICPRGNAIDTFRLWDCLYVGTIPIVVKEAVFHETVTDLPILFLENYEQFSEADRRFSGRAICSDAQATIRV